MNTGLEISERNTHTSDSSNLNTSQLQSSKQSQHPNKNTDSNNPETSTSSDKPVINADQEEIDKFEALADSWWDTESSSKMLHAINPLRAKYIEERVLLAGKQLLDVGCGGGILSEAMAYRGANVLGIDLAEKPLKIAELHALEHQLQGVQYQLTSVEQLALKQSESFDVITCMEMLEHVPDPESIVLSCNKLLKPGGTLVFSTLNRNVKSYLMAIIGAEYLLKLLPKGTHDHEKFIKPSELANVLRQTGLIVRDITGVTYNPLTKRFTLSRDVDVNYLMTATKSHQ